ncbi:MULTISPECIES: minor capsid protein [Clostridium]|uniref:Minor capsid protein n=1 Tax=Clostridium frigoriphilum TaxID=443253 RepID=A0ABU7UI22_9CLOT|nr:minor capsid protein [Clostridium sp. DSM 17811]MBU3098375.1 phage head morphogenesis protein [Clostridium sp. DSM 17811]
MDKEYRKLIEQIKVDGENYSDEEMKIIYKGQKTELDKLHALLGTLFIKYGIDGFLKMNASQKADVDIKSMLKLMGKNLGNSEVSKVTDILESVFKDTYYKNAYTMQKGMKVGLKFDMISQKHIDAAVNAKYDTEIFSDRIWKHKADLVDKLQASLIKTMNGETTIDKVARDIKNTFNVTAYESKLLVGNECARVQSQANEDIAVSTGVEQQMYSATLDGQTSSECAGDDSKIWDIDDPEKVIPPENHVGCRCCLINVPYAGWSPTQRRDNETHELIPNQTYAEWSKDKGID